MNLFSVVLLAALVVASTMTRADPVARSGNRPSNPYVADQWQQGRAPGWTSAQARLLLPGLTPRPDAGITQGQCRYLGGPKSSVPC